MRERLLKGDVPPSPQLIFDEIHKFSRWKSLVKGFYDTRKSHTQFIVTGSARLDVYKRGGDSLQGRYHHYRLHPFTLGELALTAKSTDLSQLLTYGGFPEPFTKANARHWRRWQQDRRERLIREDLRDLEHVRELSMLELLAATLPGRVGSPLTVKKEQKLYLWDWSQVEDPGARFENFVGSHLLKYCHFEQDVNGFKMELRYLRDVERRELDFVVLKDGIRGRVQMR